MAETIRVETGERILEVIAAISGEVLERFYQFVENAADAIEEAHDDEGVIHVELVRLPLKGTGRRGRSRVEYVVIRDNGIGMSAESMREVATSVGDSRKVDQMLRGEKGVGLWGFVTLCQEVHFCSRMAGEAHASCLVLETASIRTRNVSLFEGPERCLAGHIRSSPGTDVYLRGLTREAQEKLTKQRLKNYLGKAFAVDLRSNKFGLQIRDGGRYEPVTPSRFRGAEILSLSVPLGNRDSADVELYGLARPTASSEVTLLGRGGTRICPLTDVPDFARAPWSDGRLEGAVRYDRLHRTAAKSGVVEDDNYTRFRIALQQLEPQIERELDAISSEEKHRRLREVLTRVRHLLTELADRLDVRLRTEALVEGGEGDAEKGVPDPTDRVPGGHGRGKGRGRPSVAVVRPRGDGRPSRRIIGPQLIMAPPSPGKESLRSWYEALERTIYVNEEHPDYLRAFRHEDALRVGRYLTHIWIKEALLTEYRGAGPERVSDEMVGALSEAEALFGQHF